MMPQAGLPEKACVTVVCSAWGVLGEPDSFLDRHAVDGRDCIGDFKGYVGSRRDWLRLSARPWTQRDDEESEDQETCHHTPAVGGGGSIAVESVEPDLSAADATAWYEHCGYHFPHDDTQPLCDSL